MEEIDLCWRLKARGREIVCIPQSVVYHVGAATLKRENPHKTFLNFRNNLLMLYKNLPADELNRIMRIRALLDYLAALFFLLRGEWRNAREVVRARNAYRRLRPQFKPQREENLLKQTRTAIPERANYSILLKSLFKQRKN
jgi:GT2 family glycosyltransferase